MASSYCATEVFASRAAESRLTRPLNIPSTRDEVMTGASITVPTSAGSASTALRRSARPWAEKKVDRSRSDRPSIWMPFSST